MVVTRTLQQQQQHVKQRVYMSCVFVNSTCKIVLISAGKLVRRPCRYCHKLVTNWARHESLHFASTHVAYKCTYVGCTYAGCTAWALLEHERKHTGERPLICDVCAQSFARSSTLSIHRRVKHGGGGGNVARFRCQECMSVCMQSCVEK